MKIDANLVGARLGVGAQEPGSQRGDRWLAQLEKACLGPWNADSSASRDDGESHAPASGGKTPTPSPHDAADGARVAVSATSSAAGPAHGAVSTAAWTGLSATLVVATPATAASAIAQQAGQAPALASSRPAAAGDEAVAPDNEATITVAPAPVAAIGPNSSRTRSLAQATPTEDAGATAAGPPRYARQFMQLSLSESGQAQASVRDASLSTEDAAAVAQGVAAQLRSDGVVLQRVFVNGRRFDLHPGPDGHAVPTPDTIPTQE